ncbi:hypothetical protein E6H29_01505 [Candidatus Bathyarchaeota archaeon]|nr:MAG: hypothetical protein E6H29_01505 [Candidatus Bathyarchaeota archaeon]
MLYFDGAEPAEDVLKLDFGHVRVLVWNESQLQVSLGPVDLKEVAQTKPLQSPILIGNINHKERAFNTGNDHGYQEETLAAS